MWKPWRTQITTTNKNRRMININTLMKVLLKNQIRRIIDKIVDVYESQTKCHTICDRNCMTFCSKFIDINHLINDYSYLVQLITIPLPSWCCKFSSLYSSSLFLFFIAFKCSIESSRLVRDVSSLSVREVSVVSGLS